MQRQGVSVEQAKRDVIRRTTLIGALMVRQGDADAMLCGTYRASIASIWTTSPT